MPPRPREQRDAAHALPAAAQRAAHAHRLARAEAEREEDAALADRRARTRNEETGAVVLPGGVGSLVDPPPPGVPPPPEPPLPGDEVGDAVGDGVGDGVGTVPVALT